MSSRRKEHEMRIRGVAERGYPIQFPENTLSSFQAAIDLAFTHMKLEVHLTKDRIPVVMQDATLDRMTNGCGEIRDCTFEELQRFTINHDERIPALEEVLELAKGKIKLGIEIKQTGFYNGLEEKVYQVIQKAGCMSDVYILSRNHYSLARFRILSKEIELGLLTDEINAADIQLLSELKAAYYAVKFDFNTMKKLDVKHLEKMGVQLIVWTVNTIEKMKFMHKYPQALVSTAELEKYQAISYPETIINWQKVGI